MWPCQRFDISVNRVDKNITIEYDSSSKQWYMIVPPSANASEDYDVNIIQHTIKGTDFPTFAKVRVKTFDYNYTFKDENGNVIKRLTADYGQTVTAPDDTHTWVCDEYSYLIKPLFKSFCFLSSRLSSFLMITGKVSSSSQQSFFCIFTHLPIKLNQPKF